MKKYLLVFLFIFISSSTLHAQTQSPNLEERISDLEAYINNTERVADVRPDEVASRVMQPGPGHNAWLMTSAALVLFMTLPGLALFYGGLVRKKNVLSVLAQCLACAGLVTVLWWLVGYSLVFAPGSSVIGGFDFSFFKNVTSLPNTTYAYWVSHNIFAIYQLMFAIITPALIIGAIAERMKFGAILLFVTLWMLIVYFPMAHMVWGSTGFMNGVWNPAAGIKAVDFAGGTVVHMTSGWSALILCMLLGKRVGFGRDLMAPHSLVLCMVGTGMLWVGWYGFNAGSALAADGVSANAFVTTTLSAATACFVWGFLEYLLRKKVGVLGLCSGVVSGLVVITPACGFVSSSAAVGIGVFAGAVPFFAVYKLKNWLGYDDALDTFGVHAVGGTLGAILTGFFATTEANPNLAKNLSTLVGKTLWMEQIKACILTVTISIIGTLVIGFFVKAVVGLRPSEEKERLGLDLSEHGEEGYIQ